MISTKSQIPDEIRRICEDWHDGPKTAMYAAWKGQRLDVSRLRREAQKAMQENSLNHEADRLKAVYEYALRQELKRRAEETIIAAIHEAKAAGISLSQFKLIAESHY